MRVALVTGRDDLCRSLEAALPEGAALTHYPTVQALLQQSASEPHSAPPALVFLDRTRAQSRPMNGRELREAFQPGTTRFIALLDDPAMREAAFSAGDDACLLLPLVTPEVRALLRSGADSASATIGLPANLIQEATETAGPVGSLCGRWIERLRDLAGARAGWALVQEPGGREPIPLFPVAADASVTAEDTSETLPRRLYEQLRDSAPGTPSVHAVGAPDAPRGLLGRDCNYVTAIPLCLSQSFLGLVFLEHEAQPDYAAAQLGQLAALGGCLSLVLGTEFLRVQSELQAVRSGLVGLVARMLGQETDGEQVLARALEHAVPAVDGLAGGVWLFGPDRQTLELTSSLSLSPFQTLPTWIQRGRGLIGTVAAQGKAIRTDCPAKHPAFDPDQDRGLGSLVGSFLAVPLRADRELIGVMAVGTARAGDIGDQEQVFTESIADIAASRLSRTRLAEELSSQSRRQEALQAMSREIACGLDLQATLERALQWLNRLIEAETGLLWLVDPLSGGMQLRAAQGVDLESAKNGGSFLDEGWLETFARDGSTVILDLSSAGLEPMHRLRDVLACEPRDAALVPLKYRGESIGLIALVNKVGTGFATRDRALLSGVGDLIAVAVGNARLHAETVSLARERERAHVAALQATRLATVGRLTASLSHEINNPMQAIRGALALALEDLHDETAVRDYMRMSMEGAERVVQLVGRLRHIYRSSDEGPRPIDVNETVQTACAYAQATSTRQGVALDWVLAEGLPQVVGVYEQVHLVFLSLTLCLVDAIAAAGGGRLHIRTGAGNGWVRVGFVTNAPVPLLAEVFEGQMQECLTEAGVRLAFTRDIIQAMAGKMHVQHDGASQALTVELPVDGGQADRRTHARE